MEAQPAPPPRFGVHVGSCGAVFDDGLVDGIAGS